METTINTRTKTAVSPVGALVSAPKKEATADSVQSTPKQDVIIFRGTPQEERKVELPKNFVVDSIATSCKGVDLGRKICDKFEQYYRGQANLKDIENLMDDIVSDLRNSYVNFGYDESEFMTQLIQDVYTETKLANIRGAYVGSWYDSLQYAKKYNGDDRNSRDWIYYDAKYYYSSEEMKGNLQEISKKIAKKYGVAETELDLSTGYPDGDIRKGMYSSYNTYINFNAREDSMVGNIVDESMVPPKGFRFFYKGNESGVNKYSSALTPFRGEEESIFDGVLHVWYGDWSFAGRVPVRTDATKNPISVSMFDVISRGAAAIPKQIIGMLKNVDFFTVPQSGTYLKSHPRNYGV